MATLELSLQEEAAPEPVRRRRRLGLLFWMAIAWLAVVFALAILAPLLPLQSPTDMDMLERRAAFSAEHWFGTDGLGRDELARLVFGARVSLTVGLFAPMIGLAVGGGLGLLAGYFRGRFETLALLWQFSFAWVDEEFLTVRASPGWRLSEELEDGLPDGRHARLWRWSRDSFFFVPLL